jgi:hypothetical protein
VTEIRQPPRAPAGRLDPMRTADVTFHIEAIPPAKLEEIRRGGRDDAGNPHRPVTADGAEPLRCCLRLSRPGEQIALIAFQPPGGTGPYQETGPVFVHAAACGGYPPDAGWPPGFRDRQQVLRGYDHDGRIIDAVLVDGDKAEGGIAALLGDPRVALVQSRNVLYGCYMFTVRRHEGASARPMDASPSARRPRVTGLIGSEPGAPRLAGGRSRAR